MFCGHTVIPKSAAFWQFYRKFKIAAEEIIAQNSLSSIWSVKKEKWQRPELTEPVKTQPLVCLIHVQAAGVMLANANLN